MKPENPAKGILKTGEYGDSVLYHIRCECGNEDCAHEVEVEADSMNVQVHIYHTQHTKWWELNRWKQLWQILTKGYSKMETTLVMDEQTSLNYSQALKDAITNVKHLRNKRIKDIKK